ncbi:MAG: hypothetical protein FWH53_07815 [Leptospirales bacterium]|nr:hypothetical protein [Leptospirales bacterium]
MKKKNKFKNFKNSNNENDEEASYPEVLVLVPNKDKSPEAKKMMKYYRDGIIFADKVREYEEKYPLEKALKLAIKYCIARDIFKEQLEQNSSKIINMTMKVRADQEAGLSQEESFRKYVKSPHTLYK